MELDLFEFRRIRIGIVSIGMTKPLPKVCVRCGFPLAEKQVICPECGVAWTLLEVEEVRERARRRFGVLCAVVLVGTLGAMVSGGLWIKPFLGLMPRVLADFCSLVGKPLAYVLVIGSAMGVVWGFRPR